MLNQDKEIVKRVLEALLEKLTANPRDGEENTSTNPLFESLNSKSAVARPSVGSETQNTVTHRESNADELATPSAGAFAHDNNQVSHPGLERFPLADTQSNPAAPKACFMEPGRTCVGSGACEMRGY